MYSRQMLKVGSTTMLIQTNTALSQKKCLNYSTSDGSDENYEEEGDLEIDLGYDDYVDDTNDEPLDLSMKSISKNYEHVNIVTKATLPIIDIQPTFNFSEFENNNVTAPKNDNKGKIMTEKEISSLLDPYVKSVHKKFSCTVCDMKFVSRVKAVTHVENKHVDCLQYKCPLCRASKGTRLAYESHLRRGHGVKVQDYSPHVRCKRQFSVKSEAQSSKSEPQGCQPYDFQFVTFLRHILSSGQEMQQTTTSIPCAGWLDQDQGIFRINRRQEFSIRWYAFKVISSVNIIKLNYNWYSYVSGC